MDNLTLEELVGVIPLKKIIELTDDAATGSVNQANLDEAYKSAWEDYKLYVARYYAEPYPVNSTSKEFLRQLTKCHLYFRRGLYPDEIKALYDTQLKKLGQVNEMTFALPGATAKSDNPGISADAPARIFDDRFMGDLSAGQG